MSAASAPGAPTAWVVESIGTALLIAIAGWVTYKTYKQLKESSHFILELVVCIIIGNFVYLWTTHPSATLYEACVLFLESIGSILGEQITANIKRAFDSALGRVSSQLLGAAPPPPAPSLGVFGWLVPQFLQQ